jgi:hypothetical protein
VGRATPDQARDFLVTVQALRGGAQDDIGMK